MSQEYEVGREEKQIKFLLINQTFQDNYNNEHFYYVHGCMLNNYFYSNRMFVSKFAKSLRSLLPGFTPTKHNHYSPTFFLRHHVLQSIYELTSPQIDVEFERQKIYFVDGGHIALDWSNKKEADEGRPIILIMHGMTGGSQSKYIKALVKKADQNRYCSVCLNSRGINSEMTSPIPFVGVEFHELTSTIERIKILYPNNPLYIIGTSLGGNYVLRYLLSHQAHKVNGLVLISPPFDVKYVIDGMNMWYQKFFIKYYLKNTILRHDQMKFWWENGLVDLRHLTQSTNLRQFHSRITIQIMGFKNSDELFDHFKIKDEEIEKFQTKTLILTSKDDPMVGFETFPIDAINKNKNISLVATDEGGHICWFEGVLPQRWYPKPVFDFINNIEKEGKKDLIV